MDGPIELVGACRYALRTFGTRAGLWGLVKEGAWLAAHLAFYPGGAVREQLRPVAGYRTDPLSPLRRDSWKDISHRDGTHPGLVW